MRSENVIALKSAYELSRTVQKLMIEGNMEMAHRTQAVYQSLLLTVILTELVPDAAETLDTFAEVPTHAEDGSIVQ